MLAWQEIAQFLGHSQSDEEFINLSSVFNELPILETGVLGDRTYYSYFKSGVFFLLENENIEQIMLYIKPAEGFSAYRGDLPVPANKTEAEIIDILGYPASSGGGKTDMLLGYINRWIKYERANYALHLQFDSSNHLCMVTFIK
ncbi:hypothetical protein [Erwinia sp. OPT-41]|uniref:Uncharacterized protein n=1 Tax=Erwinia plantamica TaxID=3237104 RepID=A0ABW7CRH9_9GAMM